MSLTLKLAALAAMILPFRPREAIVIETVPAPALEPIVIDAEPLETVPEPEPVEVCDADTAVREYLRELMDQFGGEEIAFAAIFAGYLQLRKRSGWPKISDKLLSLRLRKFGAVRFQRDLRKFGLGKPIYFRIPLDDDDAVELAERREAA
jgi:hypothetical protein